MIYVSADGFGFSSATAYFDTLNLGRFASGPAIHCSVLRLLVPMVSCKQMVLLQLSRTSTELLRVLRYRLVTCKRLFGPRCLPLDISHLVPNSIIRSSDNDPTVRGWPLAGCPGASAGLEPHSLRYICYWKSVVQTNPKHKNDRPSS
jgi:hypothetical protein